VTLGKHKDIVLFHSAKTKIDQNLKATQRRTDMACASHFVQLKNFGRTALPRLRQPFQVVPIRIGCHNHKMVKIDLSRGVDK
jgi:hypothetical protein